MPSLSALQLLTLADLCNITSLDRRHTPPAATVVARHKIQPILSLVEFGVSGLASLA